MPNISILCTGDLHIGRVSSKCLTDTDDVTCYTARSTWLRMVDYAIAQHIDLVLISGDLADDKGNQYEAMGPFETGVSRLAAHEIPIYMVAGNHDASVLPRLTHMLADGAVHLLGRDGHWEQRNWPVQSETPLVSLLGWSYPDGRVPELPLQNIMIQRQSGVPVIALAHTDYHGNCQDYASCSLESLRGIIDVDLWLLGHIHLPEYLPGSPIILNPGSPQALDPGEPGVHGPWVLHISDGQISAIEQIPFSSVTYCSVTIDISAFSADDELVAFLLPVLGTNHLSRVSCRVTLTGRTAHLQQLATDVQHLLNEQPLLENHQLYLEQIDLSAIRPAYDLSTLATRSDVIGVLAELLQKVGQGEENATTSTYLQGVSEQIRLVMTSPAFREVQFRDSPPDTQQVFTIECRRLLDWLLRQEEARV